MDLWRCACPVCGVRGVNRVLSLVFTLRCSACGTLVGRFRRFPGVHSAFETFLILGSVLASVTLINPLPLLGGIAVFIVYKQMTPLTPAITDASASSTGADDSEQRG